MPDYQTPTIQVEPELLKQCNEFARTMGAMNQAKEFNSNQVRARSADAVARDILIGKVAECAVWQYLVSKGVKMKPVDFEIKGEGVKDSGDLDTETGKQVSVKSTEFGRRLMVHTPQLYWDLADFYVVCNTVMDGDVATGSVTIRGYAAQSDLVSLERLMEHRERHRLAVERRGEWFVPDFAPDVCGSRSGYIKQGQQSPFGNFKMQSTNVWIDSPQLRTDFGALIEALK